MFSPVWHIVWWWEQSSGAFLSWEPPQRLSEVDVPHLSVFMPKSEQFLWGWHSSVEESPAEKWPSGQCSHTVSLNGVPERDTQVQTMKEKTDKFAFLWPSLKKVSVKKNWLIISFVSPKTPQLFSLCERDIHFLVHQMWWLCVSKKTDHGDMWRLMRMTDDCHSENDSHQSHHTSVVSVSFITTTACDCKNANTYYF